MKMYPSEESVKLFAEPFSMESIKHTQKTLYDIGFSEFIWKLVEEKIKPNLCTISNKCIYKVFRR